MNQTRAPRPLTGRMVFAMLVAFFGVVIGVNLVMMRLAIKTLPGVEVDSAYSASLAYENEIATAREQAARNWKVDAHVERSGQGGATLQVEARDHAGRPMTGLTFEGRFERPTDRRADLPVTLAEVGIGAAGSPSTLPSVVSRCNSRLTSQATLESCSIVTATLPCATGWLSFAPV